MFKLLSLMKESTSPTSLQFQQVKIQTLITTFSKANELEKDTFPCVKRWMDTYLFSIWMDQFLNLITTRGDFSSIQTRLIILNRHESHINLEVLQKTRTHGLDMLSLPSHTSHDLQTLDMACFGPFKKSFRAYRNLWAMQGSAKSVSKEHLAQWAFLALIKALTLSNIKAGFRGCGIWPLNLQAMKAKMEPSKGFRRQTSN